MPPTMSATSLRAGAALPRWGGNRERATLGPPALLPPPPHIRGGAQPVQSRQLPSGPPPCGQVVLSQTAPGQDLNPKLKPLDLVPALPVLQERPWVQEVHPAHSDPGEQMEGGLEGLHRKDVPLWGKEPAMGPSLTKASPERSQRLDWYLPPLAPPTIHLVCCAGGRGQPVGSQ